MFGCICPPKIDIPKIQKNEIENSDCIFIGEVLKVYDDLTYKIKVIESLDGGDEIGNIYIGRNSGNCEPFIENTGKWIIYANNDNNLLEANGCGISRSFEYPVIKPLAPPPAKLNDSTKSKEEQKADFIKLRQKSFQIGMSQLNSEISTLRKMRG